MILSATIALLGLSTYGLSSPIPNAIDSLLARTSSRCPNYTIINTRGTMQPQGPSVGFITMNERILAAKPGGRVYDTVYPASLTQISYEGTQDILRQIDTTLAQDPNHCFFLEGYSQGAATTVDAVIEIAAGTPRFDAVKGVILLGNPRHKAGLACNVDMDGQYRTKFSNGLAVGFPTLPDRWVSKSLDICAYVRPL